MNEARKASQSSGRPSHVRKEKLISWPRSGRTCQSGGGGGSGRWMKRSKESHELPQGLTLWPYQPGLSTVLFIALNRAPTTRQPLFRENPIVSGSLCFAAARHRGAIYRDIKSNYCWVSVEFKKNNTCFISGMMITLQSFTSVMLIPKNSNFHHHT